MKRRPAPRPPSSGGLRGKRWGGSGPLIAIATMGVWLVLPGCGSDPFQLTWSQGADTVDLYSLTHPRPGLYDAYDFTYSGGPVVLESIGASGRWDVAVGGDENGLVLLPTTALGVSTTAGIAVVSGRLEDVLRAPADSSAYERLSPVPLTTGTTYVIRTRRATDYYGLSTCNFYAKMEPVVVDPANLHVRFVYGANPNCGNTNLEP